jgi:hypothetical protein
MPKINCLLNPPSYGAPHTIALEMALQLSELMEQNGGEA